jgi:hypothetical protein
MCFLFILCLIYLLYLIYLMSFERKYEAQLSHSTEQLRLSVIKNNNLENDLTSRNQQFLELKESTEQVHKLVIILPYL